MELQGHHCIGSWVTSGGGGGQCTDGPEGPAAGAGKPHRTERSLKHGFTLGTLLQQWTTEQPTQGQGYVLGTRWPLKPEILARWPFTEKLCHPCKGGRGEEQAGRQDEAQAAGSVRRVRGAGLGSGLGPASRSAKVIA